MVRFKPSRDVSNPNLKNHTTESESLSLYMPTRLVFGIYGSIAEVRDVRVFYVPNLRFRSTELGFDSNALLLVHKVPPKSFEVYGEVSTIEGRNCYVWCVQGRLRP